MRSQFLLSIILLSAAALATFHGQEDTHSDGADELASWTAGKASGKKAKVETAASSLSTFHPTKPSKPISNPTSSPSSNRKILMKTSTFTSIPTAVGGALRNHTTSERTNNSTTFASIGLSTNSVIEFIPTAASASVTKNAIVSSSTVTPSSATNLGMVQPTGVLKAAGALAIGVAAMMILL